MLIVNCNNPKIAVFSDYDLMTGHPHCAFGLIACLDLQLIYAIIIEYFASH